MYTSGAAAAAGNQQVSTCLKCSCLGRLGGDPSYAQWAMVGGANNTLHCLPAAVEFVLVHATTLNRHLRD